MSTPIPSNRVRVTAWQAVAATAGHLRQGSADCVATSLTTDSRAVAPGSLFVALRGSTHDGHAFVPDAVKRGAVLVMVERGAAVQAHGAAVVEVADTLAAWGDLARAHLRAWRRRSREHAEPARVVAITGSAGKTTTKEMCAALLGGIGGCHATAGNLNNRIGVPAVAFGLEERHRFAVFELGMNSPGEIAALADIVEPDVGVLLNVGVAHAGGVGGGRADVAREKGALFEALPRRACAVVNADDLAAAAQLARTRASRAQTFGHSESAGYRLMERTPLGVSGSRVSIERPTAAGRERLEVRLAVAGEAAALDFVAALAAAEAALKATLDASLVSRTADELEAVKGRGVLRRLNDDILVIDDTYNANPSSMRAALSTLTEVAQVEGRRAVAIIGEMKELGALAEAEHRALGDELARAHVGLVIGCGGLADLALERAKAGGAEIVRAEGPLDGAAHAVHRVRAGDAVLLKGSRLAALERVLDELVRAHGAAQGTTEGR